MTSIVSPIMPHVGTGAVTGTSLFLGLLTPIVLFLIPVAVVGVIIYFLYKLLK